MFGVSLVMIQGAAPLLWGQVNPVTPSATGFDLSRLEWVTPFDVTALAASWLRLKALGRAESLTLPSDPRVRAYLVDVGLHSLFEGDWGPGGGSSSQPPWLPLTRLESASDWDDLLSELWPVAHKNPWRPTPRTFHSRNPGRVGRQRGDTRPKQRRNLGMCSTLHRHHECASARCLAGYSRRRYWNTLSLTA